jgi:hypothetical protein
MLIEILYFIGDDSMLRRVWSTIIISLLASVISVDIQPEAWEVLTAKGNEAWISNIYYTCVNNTGFALVKSGLPDGPENYTTVDAGALKVYVPNVGVFSGDIPVIVQFPRKNGQKDVGVPNRLD